MFKTLELPGGFAPLAPLPVLCPGPTGGLKRPPDPSPNNFAPPISNSWLRPWYSYILTSGVPPENSVIIQRSTSIVYYNIGVYQSILHIGLYTHRITCEAPVWFTDVSLNSLSKIYTETTIFGDLFARATCKSFLSPNWMIHVPCSF